MGGRKVKTTIIGLLTIALMMMTATNNKEGSKNFYEHQKSFDRVQMAYENKDRDIEALLKKHSINRDSFQILIRVYKYSKELSLYAKNIGDAKFKFIKLYPMTGTSGKLGPKRRQGDKQIPEGLYHIDRFNPKSLFLLSLGINYPNEYDLKYADKNDPGGDIFIHGSKYTIGCVPIGNDAIQELYILAIEAKAKGQEKIPVHIFPRFFTETIYKQVLSKHKKNEDYSNILKALYKSLGEY
jgi:murein L,D-transpeptidase YafK